MNGPKARATEWLRGGGDTLPGLRVADLLGVAVFAASGTLAAMAAGLDLLGILVLASVTAIGGGTLRDVLLGRHPVFWIKDAAPLFVIIGAAGATVAWTQWLPVPANALRIADALGLAVFAITGARVAEERGCSPLVVVLMGTLTGSGGGVLRDMLTATVPLLLRADIYASAAVAGIVAYLLLRAARVRGQAAMLAGMAVVVAVRLLAVAYDLRLPAFGPMG